MKNNLIFEILKIELSKLQSGISICKIDFIKEYDKSRFAIYLDTSGFDLELILNQMTELENTNKKWRKTSDGEIYTGLISSSCILVNKMKIAFTILKIDFLDFIYKEKLDITQFKI